MLPQVTMTSHPCADCHAFCQIHLKRPSRGPRTVVEQRAVDGAKRACLARKLAIAGLRFPPRLHLHVLVGH